MNEFFIDDQKISLKNKTQEIQSYSYHLNEKQVEIYDRFLSAPNEEAKTFFYINLIENGIKTDVANWLIKSLKIKLIIMN